MQKIDLNRELMSAHSLLRKAKKEQAEVLETMFYMPGHVKSDTFFSMAFDQVLHTAPGVTIKRIISENPDVAKFQVRMTAGSKIPAHTHDVLEVVKVLQGNLIEKISGRCLVPGTKEAFPPDQHHELVAEENCILIAKYYRT